MSATEINTQIVRELDWLDRTTECTPINEIICGKDGVGLDWTFGDLKKRFRKDSRFFHPDKLNQAGFPDEDYRAMECFRVASDGLCLLYTSPSPRDQRGSRMPSSA